MRGQMFGYPWTGKKGDAMGRMRLRKGTQNRPEKDYIA
jgi:hypothetical protein